MIDAKRNRPWMGFTLIELLIVVAIIAILAAIAVPNFIEAQTRSKVSRTIADMRSVVTAMKSYRVDHNRYVYHVIKGPSEVPFWPGVAEYLRWEEADGTVDGIGWQLTTPITYISDIPGDPFNTASVRSKQIPHLANYENLIWAGVFYRAITPKFASPPWFGPGIGSFDFGGKTYEWSMQSAGPDLRPWPEGDTNRNAWAPYYDPSNGTVSTGDIWYFDTEGFRPRI